MWKKIGQIKTKIKPKKLNEWNQKEYKNTTQKLTTKKNNTCSMPKENHKHRYTNSRLNTLYIGIGKHEHWQVQCNWLAFKQQSDIPIDRDHRLARSTRDRHHHHHRHYRPHTVNRRTSIDRWCRQRTTTHRRRVSYANEAAILKENVQAYGRNMVIIVWAIGICASVPFI